jgi:hypothetical protein
MGQSSQRDTARDDAREIGFRRNLFPERGPSAELLVHLGKNVR